MESVKVKIRIKATVTDLVQAETYQNACVGGFFTTEDGRRLPCEEIASVCEEVIASSVTGELREEEGRMTLTYRESEDLGFPCTTKLLFDTATPEVITMVRSGGMNAAFRFDRRQPRQLCTYETPVMPIEFVVNTRSVRNTVSREGGAILLDYCMEVRGVNTQRNRLFLEVQPL